MGCERHNLVTCAECAEIDDLRAELAAMRERMKKLETEANDAFDQIRELTFDKCFEYHGLAGKCSKSVEKDWASIQTIAASAVRSIAALKDGEGGLTK